MSLFIPAASVLVTNIFFNFKLPQVCSLKKRLLFQEPVFLLLLNFLFYSCLIFEGTPVNF